MALTPSLQDVCLKADLSMLKQASLPSYGYPRKFKELFIPLAIFRIS